MVSPRNDKVVLHMSPEQYGFLKKTWTSTTPKDILMWNRKSIMGFTPTERLQAINNC